MAFRRGRDKSFLSFLQRWLRATPRIWLELRSKRFSVSHPKALAFVQAPKPAPSSFARESYFGVTAIKFTNKDGISRFGRYRIIPEAGNDHLDDAATAAKGPDYLMAELVERVGKGPVKFKIRVQIANDGDVVDDATVNWPEDRKVLELGTLTLTAPVADSAL